MRIGRIGAGIKGFYRIGGYALRWGMVHKDAQRRFDILQFWKKHGLEATMDAFGVSRRTLYGWRSRLEAQTGSVEALIPHSTAPHRRRKRLWPVAIVAEIARLRKRHPNLSKEKIRVFLVRFCDKRRMQCPAERTIGRLIADAPDKMRHAPARLRPNGQLKGARVQRLRKPQHFRAQHPGHCVGLDSIERRVDNERRFIITFTDLHSHFAFALATRSHAAAAARAFFGVMSLVFPYPIEAVLTDNGSEFMREFHAELQRLAMVHWHTYPKTPKMNAHCERFNRTVQDEFVDYHEALLFTDLYGFNLKLLDWLNWYNRERPHFSLTEPVPGRKTPALLSPLQFLYKYHQCNMCWPDTVG
jgi:transposase InsO family protein